MNPHDDRILAHSPPVIERLLCRRWMSAGIAGLAMLGVMTAAALVPSGDEARFPSTTVVEPLSISATALPAIEDQAFLHEEQIQRSDTLYSLISRLGIADRRALDFIRLDASAQAISRQLRPGKTVTAKTRGNGELLALYFPLNAKDSTLVVERRGAKFVAEEHALLLQPQIVIKSGEISSSLFGATDAAGIPDAVARQLAEIFASDIDFYRDLRKGDHFSLVYEGLMHAGQAVRSGQILAVHFVNNRRSYEAYWYQDADGKGAYYTADGKSLRKAFLRSPLEFTRITSGFSNARLHPVLNITRAHKGIDYAAPTGTPVRAIGDATVEFAGKQNGYGNLVVLKHFGHYSTAYGHLNGFAASVRKGSKVRQGETIGYVGQTGLATGPHLHYEFRVNTQQVNPLALDLPTAIPLDATQITRFKSAAEPLRAYLALAKQTVHLASSQ